MRPDGADPPVDPAAEAEAAQLMAQGNALRAEQAAADEAAKNN